MKIAILTSGILPVPAVQGGAVENLIDFYLEYNEQHRLHDITVYSVWNYKVKEHPALLSNVNHYRYIDTTSIKAKIQRRLYKMFHSSEYYNYFIEYFFEQAYQDIQEQVYDCIIIENRPGYVYKLSKRYSKSIMLHLHNDLLNSETPHCQEIFNHLQQIVTVSDYIARRVSSIQASEKILTIHNGIDLQRFSKEGISTCCRKDFGFTSEDFVLVFSGRINKDKGIEELIDAMLLLKDLPRLKLLVLGSTFFGNANNDDDFTHSLKNKVKAIEKRIVFTGFVPYDKIPDYLKIADIAVIPSIWDDPFPTTVLEAQAMGLPLIVSNRGGIPEETSQHNALVIPTEHSFIEKLADAIRLLYNTPQLCTEMAAASLRNAVNYDKKRYSQEFFEAIESIS